MKLSNAPTQRLGARLAVVATLAGTPACTVNLQTPENQASPSATPSGYHTDRRDTRTVTQNDEDYPESVRIAENAAQLEGLMNASETAKMQSVHNDLYSQYMNPAFMMHLKSRGYSKEVFPFLDMIMKQPDKFEYRGEGNGDLEIVRREPYTKPENPADEIPKDFLVVMQGREREVIVVGDRELKVSGKIPWISNEKFSKDSEIYHARWKNEFRNLLFGEEYRKFRAAGWAQGSQKARDEWRKVKTKAYKGVSGPIKEIHLNMNVEFPKRFVELVKSRGLAFEENDPQIQDVIAHQAVQWSTYEELESHPNSPNMVVVPDDKIKGAYKILTSRYEFNPLRVDQDGYVLRPQPNDSWERDTRYKEAVRRKYYRNNPSARVDLQGPEKKEERERMEDNDRYAPTTGARVSGIHAFILEREEVDKKVYDKSTPLTDLRRAAIAILDPNKSAALNAKRAVTIGTMNRKELREEIKLTLDGDLWRLDETRNNLAAGELGVILP